ncbi:helix-turn-helix transcriptional regulator [Dyadobacter sp. CY356]|uniref:helix-turn-helix transcriptional regulator n=1 Tax=Dyadobacter sp. CY356 TaxID=2906442 RepID=UPI001F242AF5|nr:response regulator transcription factor [Dyadobacter sp. CY356]MCF0055071.1 helix-turn-helix transcriptional regulator [Dyadobacter sp. CY356]
MLELNVNEPENVLDKLAEVLGATYQNGYLKVPEKKGKGYLRGFSLGNSIGMMIRDCEFNEGLLIKRNFNLNPHERVLMSFNNILLPTNQSMERANIQNLPSVQIGKGRLNLEMFYPSHTNFRSILVAIYVSDLKMLLGNQIENSILQTLLKNQEPILFEEIITPRIQKVAIEITENDIPETLNHLYYRLKAEELICLVFAELLKRQNTSMQAINEIDAEKVYQIRAKILIDLSTPPVLEDLARQALMSKSKLKRLFKQIFGESIFNYYQSFRMKEAARLLKERRLSVSEVGYEMGFSNLGHFTRVFEEHVGMKPKRFSLQ